MAEGPNGEKTMFESVINELKKELYPECATFSRFSFIVKLLNIKSYYRISNVAFTELLKLLSKAFPACELPTSYDGAMKLISELAWDMVTLMCAGIIVFCTGNTMQKVICVRAVVNQDGKREMQKGGFLRRYYDITH